MQLWKEISPGYEEIGNFVDSFNRSSFRCDTSVERYVSFFNLDRHFAQLDVAELRSDVTEIQGAVSEGTREPFEPVVGDLARLHWIVLNRKVLNALEFGSGYSTAIIADAMSLLSGHFGNWATENTRVEQTISRL